MPEKHEQLAEWLEELEVYKKAFDIACQLLNDDCVYGIDSNILFNTIMERNGIVSSYEYQKFILENLDRFSDDDDVRHNAIERLGW